MKKVLSMILAAAMLCCLTTAAFSLSTGDLDRDGIHTAADARTVLRAAVELDELTPEQFAAADVDGDGQITAGDARAVLRTAVGLENVYGLQIPADFKVGFLILHDEESGYDKNVIDAAKTACSEMGLSADQYVIKTGVSESDESYAAAVELVESGCDVIFSDAYGHEPFLLQAAQEYPDVLFANMTGTRANTEGVSNYKNIYASVYEGKYLAGVAAGLKLNQMIEAGKITAEEAKLGFVGAFPYAQCVSVYTAFYLGARSVCPTATMEVNYAFSWYDAETEATRAEELINEGCKVISQYSDSVGAPQVCAEAGVPNVSDTASYATAFPGTHLTSTRINWVPCFTDIMRAVIAGDELPTDWVGTLADGSVQLEKINGFAAAPGTAEAVETAKKALLDGSVRVFDTANFTVEGEHITSCMADVEDDGTFTPETEAIVDGCYMESYFRSAPYFDVRIDGITEDIIWIIT